MPVWGKAYDAPVQVCSFIYDFSDQDFLTGPASPAPFRSSTWALPCLLMSIDAVNNEQLFSI